MVVVTLRKRLASPDIGNKDQMLQIIESVCYSTKLHLFEWKFILVKKNYFHLVCKIGRGNIAFVRVYDERKDGSKFEFENFFCQHVKYPGKG